MFSASYRCLRLYLIGEQKMNENTQPNSVGTANADNSTVNGSLVGINYGSIHNHINNHAQNIGYPFSSEIDIGALRTRFIVNDNSAQKTIFSKDLLKRISRKILANKIVIIRVERGFLSRLVMEESAKCVVEGFTSHLSIRVLENIFQHDDRSKFEFWRELRYISEPSVLMIPNATREHLGWNIGPDVTLVSQDRHFVIAVTELEKSTWSLLPSEEVYWLDIRQMNIFESEYLTSYLLNEIKENHPLLPPNLRYITKPSDKLGATKTIDDIAKLLKSPITIKAFLQALIQTHEKEGVLDYQSIIDFYSSKDMRNIFTRWFESLSDAEKSHLIAVYVLEGATEKQIIAALRSLISGDWNDFGFNPGFIDRIHLRKLHTYYNFSTDHFDELPIEGLAEGQRDELLRLLIINYVGLLEKTVHWLPSVVIRSFEKKNVEEALFGTDHQRNLLRNAISITLSELGLRKPDIVLPAYIKLVSNDNQAVHFFIGRTLARWYSLDSKSELISLLKGWYQNGKFLSKVKEILDLSQEPQRYSPATLINSVILITIAYAWRDAQVDKFDDELRDLMKLVVQDTSERIKTLLRYNVIPMLWSSHPHEFSSILQNLVADNDFREDISTNIAILYGKDKNQACVLVHEWIEKGLKTVPNSSLTQNAGQGEYIFLTLAEALGKMSIYTSQGTDIDVLCEEQRRILEVVYHVEIRPLVWDMCFDLASNNHKALTELIHQTKPDEERFVVERLVNLFETQCDSRMDRGNRWNPLWSSPFFIGQKFDTTVEKALLTLLQDWTLPDLQEIAFQTLFNCAIYALKKRSQLSFLSTQNRDSTYVDWRSTYNVLIVPILAIQNQPDAIRKTVQVLLYHAREDKVHNSEAFDLFINSMLQYKNSFIRNIALCLQKAIRLDEDQWWGLQTEKPRYVILAIKALWESDKLPREVTAILLVASIAITLVVVLMVYAIVYGWF